MSTVQSKSAHSHPFVEKPNRTILVLSIPLLFSLIAEPLTGLVDTAFVASLGAEALAALGVGTAALSSIFWIFNFLGIGTQTEIAQALGRGQPQRAQQFAGLALLLSAGLGLLMIGIGWFLTPALAAALGADGAVQLSAVDYMQVRLFGAPAVLVLLASFGVLRGLQDMRTPLWIAVSLNAVNIVLDSLFILGAGPLPALGIAGAALASVIAQWFGALWAAAVVIRRMGWPQQIELAETRQLLKVGGDLFIRTGLLNFYLLLTTRAATQIGVESGAAHQAIRQVWLFMALALDALALTAQSLVGFFLGSDWVAQARRVAKISCAWGLGLGVLLALGMFLGQGVVVRWLVPETAVSVFISAWFLAAVVQPVNALAFVTDGVHWGTGDFRYLRNGMLAATFTSALLLWLVGVSGSQSLALIWLVTAVWIILRAAFGMLRIWPGIGRAPLTIGRSPLAVNT